MGGQGAARAETTESAEDMAAAEKYSVAPDDRVRLSILFIDEPQHERGRPIDVWRREDHTPTAVERLISFGEAHPLSSVEDGGAVLTMRAEQDE